MILFFLIGLEQVRINSIADSYYTCPHYECCLPFSFSNTSLGVYYLYFYYTLVLIYTLSISTRPLDGAFYDFYSDTYIIQYCLSIFLIISNVTKYTYI